MNRELRLITEFYRTPWALQPSVVAAAQFILHRWAAGVKLNDDDINAAIGDAPAVMGARAQADANKGGDHIAVLPVFGVIGHRVHEVERSSSGMNTSIERLTQNYRALQADPSVGAIVLDIKSPGGSVFGVGELAGEIRASRGTKRVVAVANDTAASAAYWLASAADEIVVTPSGQVGSIGVWTAHKDMSKALANEGVDVKLISAGKYKVEGHPYGPLDPEAEAAIQHQVDQYYTAFVNAVAEGRGDSPKAVRSGYGEGRMLIGEEAVASKLADRVGTLDSVIAGLQAELASRPNNNSRRASAERRLRLAQ